MSRAEAEAVALECYGGSPSAAEIIVELSAARDQEHRFRLSMALAWLDPMNDEPAEPPGPRAESEVDKLCNGIRYAILGHDRIERLKAAHKAMELLADAVKR